MKNNALVLLGAVLGGLVGYALFSWLMQQGFYALAVPGGFVGLGAGIFKTRSIAVSVACGVLALATGLLTRWHFGADESFGYFLAHIMDLSPITLIMIAVGTVIGFWVPFRRVKDVTKA